MQCLVIRLMKIWIEAMKSHTMAMRGSVQVPGEAAAPVSQARGDRRPSVWGGRTIDEHLGGAAIRRQIAGLAARPSRLEAAILARLKNEH